MPEFITVVQDLIERGGVLMIPILASSVVTLAIFIERMWALRDQRLLGGSRFEPIVTHYRSGDFERACTVAKATNTAGARILAAGLSVHDAGADAMKTAMEDEGRKEVVELRHHVETLGTIASITPLMGLLGTVLGMIDVFQGVVADADLMVGAVNPASLASGIWTALLTTAAGLSVAIPSFVAYRFLQGRCERFTTELTAQALLCLRARYPLSGVAPTQPREVE